MMVFLESVRFNPRVALRNVVAGQQVPMESTSLGRAYLAGITEQERAKLLATFKRRGASETQNLLAEVQRSIRSVKRDGYAPPRGSAAFWLLRHRSSSRGCRCTRSI